MTRFRWLTASLMVLVLVTAGCGGGDDPGDESAADEATNEPAEPEGQVLIEDDFDDDDNLWLVDELDFEGEQDLSIDDGVFTTEWQSDYFEQIDEDEGLVPNQLWPSVLDGVVDELVDLRVEATVAFETPGTAGLVCRIADVTPDATDYRAYFFQVSSSGQVNLAESDEEGNLEALDVVPDLDDDELEEVDELPLEDAAFDVAEGGDHELAMSCVDGEDGVEIAGSIDGEEVVSATDDEDPIESGQAGVLSGQSRLATRVDGFEPFEVVYDSVVITNLGDEIDEDDLDESADDAEAASEEPEDEPTATTSPSVEPTDELASALLGEPIDPTSMSDFGTDPDFDLLATNCYLGTFLACDDLYRQTPVGGVYEAYGATCGGRLETTIDGDCEDAATFASRPGSIPASEIAEFGSDPTFDDLALGCETGDLEDCDELYRLTPVGSGYEAFGSTCGARDTVEYDGNCIG